MLLEDNAATQKTNAGHHAGRNAGRIEARRTHKTMLGDNHEQGSANGHQDVRPHAGPLGPVFPFQSDNCTDSGSDQQPDDEFQSL